MKIIITSLVLSSLIFSCTKKKVEPKTDQEKTVYTLGSMLASRFKTLNLTDRELDILNQGIRDAAKGDKAPFDTNQYQSKVQTFFKERMTAQAEGIKKKGEAFLKNFVEKEGGKKTASGLAYKVLKAGTGKSPKATDQVEVHYHGTLIDGTVFDSSVDRGDKVTFPLNRVIKGWTEGLQLVKEGGKVRLVIPSELAYGDHGAPPKIPGGATLIFDVELFKVMAEKSKK